MSLLKQSDATEVDYQLSVLKKRDFTVDDLLDLYQKAKVTLMSALMKMGRMTHYDKIMELYQNYAYDNQTLQHVVKKLYARCMKMLNLQTLLVQIFTNFKKHKVAYQTLDDLAQQKGTSKFNYDKA